MKSTSQGNIKNIVDETELSKAEKIKQLLVIRGDCRAAERAATESGMTGNDTLGTDLKLVDEALDDLGYDIHNLDESAATL